MLTDEQRALVDSVEDRRAREILESAFEYQMDKDYLKRPRASKQTVAETRFIDALNAVY